jgi:lactoylglutathione lyase
MGIVPIDGLWETHLTVSDLERSVAFYRDTLGLALAHRVPERHVAFFWIGQPRQAMLGLWGRGPWENHPASSPVPRSHFAFQATVDNVVASVAALLAVGLRPRSSFGDAIEEPDVHPWIPAASVYFDDPDGHSLEYIAVLPDRPVPTAPRMPLSAWRRRHA